MGMPTSSPSFFLLEEEEGEEDVLLSLERSVRVGPERWCEWLGLESVSVRFVWLLLLL